MASGWAQDGAVQDQIDSTVNDAVDRARQSLGQGESAEFCHECGEPIPLARRKALKDVQYCVTCQAALDKKQQDHAGYNRRGSKDSQLR
ncbi:DksA/TraR family C4-type zinc finger protein [Rahnella sp. PAMC 25559]|uniref:DksA/TraR family C4-type zinc finger protein n=1 Tax=Rahnella sp. PAMC 25559 TaxID=3423225 RepID=UPI003D66979D